MIKTEEKIGVKGIHIFNVCDMTSPAAQELERQISEHIKTREPGRGHWDRYRALVNELNNRFSIRQFVVENLTTTAGRSVLMQRLSGTTTYTGIVNYCALGTNSTAPAVSDTQLGTETYRKTLSSGTYVSNIAYLETFFTASEVSGTFAEYGFFVDGTASANTGILWNRFLSSVTKSVTQSLNVQSIISLASS